MNRGIILGLSLFFGLSVTYDLYAAERVVVCEESYGET